MRVLAAGIASEARSALLVSSLIAERPLEGMEAHGLDKYEGEAFAVGENIDVEQVVQESTIYDRASAAESLGVPNFELFNVQVYDEYLARLRYNSMRESGNDWLHNGGALEEIDEGLAAMPATRETTVTLQRRMWTCEFILKKYLSEDAVEQFVLLQRASESDDWFHSGLRQALSHCHVGTVMGFLKNCREFLAKVGTTPESLEGLDAIIVAFGAIAKPVANNEPVSDSLIQNLNAAVESLDSGLFTLTKQPSAFMSSTCWPRVGINRRYTYSWMEGIPIDIAAVRSKA